MLELSFFRDDIAWKSVVINVSHQGGTIDSALHFKRLLHLASGALSSPRPHSDYWLDHGRAKTLEFGLVVQIGYGLVFVVGFGEGFRHGANLFVSPVHF